MKDFSNAFGNVELPQQGNAGGNKPSFQSNVDWDAFGKKQLEVLGVDTENGGEKAGVIGVITNAIELGLQNQDEQTIPVNGPDYSNHEWRLEKYEDSGLQKDPSASIQTRWYRKQQQECLVYTPLPVKQFALVLDFPEVMFPYGEFFDGSETKPLRVIMGKEGFITKSKAELAGTRNLIAKPFNLKHVNVNRGKEGVQPHMALAKNGKVVKIADFAGVLDGNGNFHAQDVGKLIGKAVMCDIKAEVQRWESQGIAKSKVVIDAEITAKLGPRDVPYFENELKGMLTDDLFGFVLFNGQNDENTLKTLNSALINTMKLSPEFENSQLKQQLESLGKLGGDNASNNAPQASQNGVSDKPEKQASVGINPTQKEVQSVPQEPDVTDDGFDFDSEIPF
ncbi:hypothetical protein AXI64_gp176 [Vibrio phage qdvp001]|uniref:hypothetical protein n=1 Tax=Vibrio phage qdvp001 TaxID=1003177 RepID=UPI00071ED010|nr:hypothetical protein AXI64_gp176 [Vibrio phage qdvp001]ALM62168.1 hypothetical protein qdvp001_176 [Vibrio phage qdvp001]